MKYIALLALISLSSCGPRKDSDAEVQDDPIKAPHSITPPDPTKPPDTAPSLSKDPIKILSLDGGGVRGFITISLLEGIEEAIGRPLNEVFDLIIGTSSGGIIALALNSIGPDGGLRSAKNIKEFFSAESKDLFSPEGKYVPTINPDTEKPILEADGRPRKPYDAHFNSKKVLEKLLGSGEFNNLPKHVIVTTVDAESSTGFPMSSNDVRFDNVKTYQAGLATLTFPDTFSPFGAKGNLRTFLALEIPLKDEQGQSRTHYLMGGGLYKNNPSLLGIDAMEGKFGRDSVKKRGIFLLSVGAGRPAKSDGKSMVGANVYQWMDIIVEAISDGSSTEDEETLDLLFKTMPHSKLLRIEPQLDNKTYPDILRLNNIEAENIQRLLQIAEEEKKSEKFNDAVKLLKTVIQ